MASKVAPTIFEELFGSGPECELVDGELRAKPMVSIYHALITSWLSMLLNQQVGDDLYVLSDPLAKIREDEWRRPDTAVIRAEDAEPWKYVMPGHWPVLCVEIVSLPDQTVEEMLEKCKLYHKQGVTYCWVIEPESQAAWTYHRNEAPVWVPTGEGGTLAARDIGINVKLAELWKGLKRKRGNRLS